MRWDSGSFDDVFGLEEFRFFVGEGEAVGGEADGGGHVFGEGEAAVGFLGVGETGDGAGTPMDL